MTEHPIDPRGTGLISTGFEFTGRRVFLEAFPWESQGETDLAIRLFKECVVEKAIEGKTIVPAGTYRGVPIRALPADGKPR